jgi:hypothetical protein
MKDKLKIVSNGTAHGTSVLHNGKLLKNVTRIEILPITPDSEIVQACITFINVDLDIVVEPCKK